MNIHEGQLYKGEKQMATTREEKIKNELSGLTIQGISLDTKVTALDAKVTALDAKVTALDAKVTALDAKVTALDAKVIVLETEVTALKTEVKILQTQVTALDIKVTALDAKVIVLDAKITVLDTRVTTIERRLDDLQQGQMNMWGTLKEMKISISEQIAKQFVEMEERLLKAIKGIKQEEVEKLKVRVVIIEDRLGIKPPEE